MSLVDKLLPRVDRTGGAPSASAPSAVTGTPTLGDASPDALSAETLGEVRCCGTCGAEAASDQLVCLECGTRLDQPRPRWQQPAIAATIALVFVGALALGLSEVSKDPDVATAKTVKTYVAGPPPPQQIPDAPTTTPTTPKAPKVPKTSTNPTDTASTSSPSYPSSGSTGSTGSTGSSVYSGGYTGGGTTGGSTTGDGTGTTTPSGPPPVDEWKTSDKAAWTVVMLSTTSKDEAERYARKLTKNDIEPVGILRSNEFKNLASGVWVVWAGRFGGKVTGEDKAYAAADDYADQGFEGEAVQYIRPRAPSNDDQGSDESEDGGSDQGSSDESSRGSDDSTSTTTTTTP